MKQYIYFEGKTEFIFNRDIVKQYPIGKLLFAILDTDWNELSKRAKTAWQMTKRSKVDNAEDKPYVLAAVFYQEQRDILQSIHPHLFDLVDAYLEEKTDEVFGLTMPVAHNFALRIFRFYPHTPVSSVDVKNLSYENRNSGDGPFIEVAIRFVHEILKLYVKMYTFMYELKAMIEFVLDDAGKYTSLNAQQRFYLMQISESPAFRSCIELYENVGVERRILKEAELNNSRHKEITPELIKEVQDSDLNAYMFYRSTDIRSLAFLEFEYMCTNDLKVRKCEHCGRYFLPYSKVSLFCERPVDDTGKTCKDIGAMEKYNQKIMTDEARNLFRRLNNAYQMRTRRAPGVYTREAYEEWRDNARDLLKQVEEGEMTVGEFEERIHVNVKQN